MEEGQSSFAWVILTSLEHWKTTRSYRNWSATRRHRSQTNVSFKQVEWLGSFLSSCNSDCTRWLWSFGRWPCKRVSGTCCERICKQRTLKNVTLENNSYFFPWKCWLARRIKRPSLTRVWNTVVKHFEVDSIQTNKSSCKSQKTCFLRR